MARVARPAGTKDPGPAQGGMGTAPPPGAPHEVAQPLTEAAVADQLARAQANERALAPLVYAPGPLPAATPERRPGTGRLQGRPLDDDGAIEFTGPPSAVEALTGGVSRRIRQVKRPSTAAPGAESIASEQSTGMQPSGIVLTDAPAPPPSTVDLARGAVDPPKDAHQPAGVAFGVESPSRGVPRAVDDPGKKITGGFGDTGEAQYYPLDGSEVRVLIDALMDDLHARLLDDLRFTMAITYPRVAARVIIEVQGFVDDQSFDIVKVMPPHTKTPLEVARAHATEIAFVIVAERVEMTADGQSVSPPNATREELGLVVPRKQAVETATGRQMVDVVPTA